MKFDFDFLTKNKHNPSIRLWVVCKDQRALIKIARKANCRKVYIPLLHEYLRHMSNPSKRRRKIDETCQVLLRFVGAELFFRLMEIYGGKELRIPTEAELLEYFRDRAIYQAYKRKTSVAALAMQFQITVPETRSIIAKQKKLSQLNTKYTSLYLNLKRAVASGENNPKANYIRFMKSRMGILVEQD